MKLACSCTLVLALSGSAMAEQLTLAMTEGGYPPFSYYDENQQEQGFYREMMDLMSTSELEFHYQELPRKRIGLIAKEDPNIFRIANPKWVSRGSLISEPITEYVDTFFSLDENLVNISEYEQLIGKHICANRGFIYSEQITKLFESEQAIRVDVSSELIKLTMLERERCDLLIGEQSVVRHIAQQIDFQPKLYQTQLVDAIWPMHFVLHPEQTELLEYINQQIQELDIPTRIDKLKQEL